MISPGTGRGRSSLERASTGPLLTLRRLPRWLPPLALLGLLIAGLSVPGWIGAAALVLVAMFLGWLYYLSWPALGPRGRLLRIAAIAVVLALAVLAATR